MSQFRRHSCDADAGRPAGRDHSAAPGAARRDRQRPSGSALCRCLLL